ncbi:unnamed protein product [Bursaphelenchus xylophilus]|uniref:(pine wood nematode) hypothetical protein n=1 Tax=Bursaphelenchus xylophilus TaxID=6326 RepID=A0A1I7RNP8_BURXY|nr:unnamed protein product [Bursaphelenchus xylophilus]CAG9124208.1 unnamed protein product [Bursaphelenchus xylophilus]
MSDEVDTDSCVTALSGYVFQPKLSVSLASLSVSTVSVDSVFPSSGDMIPELSDGDLLSVNDPFSSDQSTFSLTSLNSSLFNDVTSFEESSMTKDKNFDDSSCGSSCASATPSFHTSDIQTRFDDDFSYEYDESFVESEEEDDSGLKTGIEYENDDEIWCLETGFEMSDPNKSIGVYTAIDRDDIRL